MRLSRRSFVDRLDFVTSPGHLNGGDARRRLGMPGGGPALVVTDRAVFDFGAPGAEMRLRSLHAGETLEGVRGGVAWDLAAADELEETPEPTGEAWLAELQRRSAQIDSISVRIGASVSSSNATPRAHPWSRK